MSDGFAQLRDTVQRLRENRFPDLSAELVDDILAAERTHEDERERSLRDVRSALEAAVAAEEQEED